MVPNLAPERAMPLILVVEQEQRYVERISEAFTYHESRQGLKVVVRTQE